MRSDADHRLSQTYLTVMLQYLAAAWFVVFAYAATLFVTYVWQRFFSRQGLPESIPWADAEQGALSRAIATTKSFFGLREIIQDGYHRVSNRPQLTVLVYADSSQVLQA
jgi:hypothetical protein